MCSGTQGYDLSQNPTRTAWLQSHSPPHLSHLSSCVETGSPRKALWPPTGTGASGPHPAWTPPFFFFWLCHTACGILVADQGSNPRTLHWKLSVSNTGTSREVPGRHILRGDADKLRGAS